jgi:hypothetical protein
MTGELWFESRYGIQILLDLATLLQALGPKEHHALWVSRLLLSAEIDWGMKLIIYLYLVTRNYVCTPPMALASECDA